MCTYVKEQCAKKLGVFRECLSARSRRKKGFTWGSREWWDCVTRNGSFYCY